MSARHRFPHARVDVDAAAFHTDRTLRRMTAAEVGAMWLQMVEDLQAGNWDAVERLGFTGRIRAGTRRSPIPPKLRQSVFQRDGRCVACGSAERLELDHVFPWSRGGGHTAENLQVLCRRCNSTKRAKTMAEWLGVDDA